MKKLLKKLLPRPRVPQKRYLLFTFLVISFIVGSILHHMRDFYDEQLLQQVNEAAVSLFGANAPEQIQEYEPAYGERA
ncbi:MAG TPA: hypothetical protein VK543_02760 [Puia sp.]|nr:hypothetical protein [Puia sp.]